MLLTEAEIRLILRLIDEHDDATGYSADPATARLQAKLSMMLEAKMRARGPTDGVAP